MALNSALLINDIKTRLTNELNFNFTDAVQASSMEIMVDEIINHLVTYTEVMTTLDQTLQSIFLSGVPAPPDGGTALQAAWTAATAAGVKDKASGTIQ